MEKGRLAEGSVLRLGLPFFNYVAFGKFLDFLVPPLPNLQNGDNLDIFIGFCCED